jgi:hypothetical protein
MLLSSLFGGGIAFSAVPSLNFYNVAVPALLLGRFNVSFPFYRLLFLFLNYVPELKSVIAVRNADETIIPSWLFAPLFCRS